MAKLNQRRTTYENKSMDLVFVIAIIAFMLIIPFYRGLFFRENYIPSIMAVGLIFLAYVVYKLVKRAPITLNTYMDLVFAAIPIIYLISFFFSVNAKDAFDQFLIYSAYFMVYKISSALVQNNNKYKTYFINGIILSTFILSFTSILDLMKIIDLQIAFEGNRLFGLYQYPNTTASVLGIGIVLALNAIINEKNIKFISIYQIALTAALVSFIFTLSRGAYLIVTGVMLFNFLIIDARQKLKFVLSVFISVLSSSYLIYKFYTLDQSDLSQTGMLYFSALLVSGILAHLIHLSRRNIKINISNKVINTALVLIVIVIVGSGVALFSIKESMEYRVEHTDEEESSWKHADISLYDLEPSKNYSINFDVLSSKENQYSYGVKIMNYNAVGEAVKLTEIFESVGTDPTHKVFSFKTLEDTKRVIIHLYNYEADSYTIYKNVMISDASGNYSKLMKKYKYIPQTISNRLEDINLETTSSSMRITFTKDGLEIIKDYPLLGAGGGAWKNIYRKYQSAPYNSTETHNYYVQYATEVGIIGLVALSALLLLFILNMYKAIKNKSEFLSVYVSALLLLLHSTIDFNLSLVAVGYLLWFLMGVLNGDEKMNRLESKITNKSAYLILILAFTIPLCALSIFYGIGSGKQAAKAITEKKDTEKALELYEKASKLDRYNGAYRIDLAQILSNQLRKTKEKKYLEEFNKQVSLIKRYEPYNHQYTPIMCNMYLAMGNLDEASRLADKKLIDEPMVEKSYMIKIDINYEIASYYVKDEKIQEAMPYLEKILEANSEFENVNSKLKDKMELSEDYHKKVEAASNTLEMIKADMK